MATQTTQIPQGKVATIINFLDGMQQVRQTVREDALALMKELNITILSDVDLLADFLSEVLTAIADKHLVSEKGRVRPVAAKLVREYVAGMKSKKRSRK